MNSPFSPRVFSQFTIFLRMLEMDMHLLKSLIKDKIIDYFIWVVSQVLIFRYLMPHFGLSVQYSTFIMAGMCASGGLFQIFPTVVSMVSDFNNDRVVLWYLLTPVPSYLLFIRWALFCGFSAFIMGISVLPLGKLLLWDLFDLSKIQMMQFFLVFMCINIFFGCFALWLVSFLKTTERVGTIWMRMMYPLWSFGCYNFSWKLLYASFPLVAYINLLNPLTYVMEGGRAALLGSPEYISSYWSALALTFYSLTLGWWAFCRIRSRLDFI